MNNPLSKLTLDYWYKVLIVAGAFVFLLNGTGVLSAYPPGPTALVSLGVFFWGIGEWINYPYQEMLQYDGLGRVTATISGYPRNPKRIGVVFDILAFVLIAIGVWKFF